ncbi:MAG: hypothetical protein DRN12_03825 [Thermoplasmata archaeon]|nr:MAG: hypothetical protein DRN12_03825 [Thermoplasmata archaeon]
MQSGRKEIKIKPLQRCGDMKKSKFINVRITEKMYAELEKIAESKGLTLPDLIRHVLVEYIERHKS